MPMTLKSHCQPKILRCPATLTFTPAFILALTLIVVLLQPLLVAHYPAEWNAVCVSVSVTDILGFGCTDVTSENASLISVSPKNSPCLPINEQFVTILAAPVPYIVGVTKRDMDHVGDEEVEEILAREDIAEVSCVV